MAICTHHNARKWVITFPSRCSCHGRASLIGLINPPLEYAFDISLVHRRREGEEPRGPQSIKGIRVQHCCSYDVKQFRRSHPHEESSGILEDTAESSTTDLPNPILIESDALPNLKVTVSF